MKLSKGFWQTYKENPADAEIPSHKLMMRAGLIQKEAAGLYNYLPMGYRSIRKVENIIREEMDCSGYFELLMTMVTPGELWQESGRWNAMEGLMLKFKDKGNRDLCLSPTNEETVTDIFRKTVKSYKQLPVTLYQINTKFRDEIRPRFGLMRGREFLMKDAYSFHTTKECLDEVYEDIFKTYERILERIGLNFTAVEADAGAMGGRGSKTHEFQVLAETGEDDIIFCDETGYAANIEKAQTKRPHVEFFKTEKAIEEVETPNMKTIEDVCQYLQCPQYQSLKSLIYSSITGEDEEIVLIQLLGDDQLNEVKLKNYLNADHIAPISEARLEELRLPRGFIGPYGDISYKTIFDAEVDLDAAYVAGALKDQFHIKNLIPKRDLSKYEVADLRLAKKGDLVTDGEGIVDIKRGIEVGHIFQLGDKYTRALDAVVLDQNGKAMHPLMGCYGMGVSRIISAVIEQNHDENGIHWPLSVAPYHLYFAVVAKTDEFKELSTSIYEELMTAGMEVLFDDRKISPGIKFKDSDLLGLPIRLVLGERDYKKSNKLEIVVRKTGEKIFVEKENLVSELKKLLRST